MTTLLSASKVAIEIDGRELVSNLDLHVDQGQSLGIVGETGSGKSLSCRALAGSLGAINGRVSRGALSLAGHDLVAPNRRLLSTLYGRTVSFVPQNSLSALNPLMRIGTHMTETVKVLDPKARANERAIELLERVGLREPQRVMRQYPHELSGGMRQRVMIALAIAGRPALLIADEPTTALDVSVQKEVIDLLGRLTSEEGMALVLVSHDLGVVAAATESIVVMYAGMVVERGPVATVLRNPKHPYTRALLAARPTFGEVGRLAGIAGSPPSPDAWPSGCRFAPRCQYVQPRCGLSVPPLEEVDASHVVACVRKDELDVLYQVDVGLGHARAPLTDTPVTAPREGEL